MRWRKKKTWRKKKEIICEKKNVFDFAKKDKKKKNRWCVLDITKKKLFFALWGGLAFLIFIFFFLWVEGLFHPKCSWSRKKKKKNNKEKKKKEKRKNNQSCESLWMAPTWRIFFFAGRLTRPPTLTIVFIVCRTCILIASFGLQENVDLGKYAHQKLRNSWCLTLTWWKWYLQVKEIAASVKARNRNEEDTCRTSHKVWAWSEQKPVSYTALRVLVFEKWKKKIVRCFSKARQMYSFIWWETHRIPFALRS